MKSNLLNISVIKNFVQVVDMGSITSAAERLFITQPTLSRQIASLEEELKVSLLKRVKNGVVLTEEGMAFYKQCKKFIKACDEFVAKAFEFQNLVVGSLKIAYHKASEKLLIRYNSEFLRTYPNVSIQSLSHTLYNPIEELGDGELDFAYIYSRELNRKYKDIRSIRVASTRNMLLVSSSSPLAERDSVKLSELSDQPFILPSKGINPFKADEAIAGCKRMGFTPRVVSTAADIVEFQQEIIRFNGVAILPFLPELEKVPQVKYLELEEYEQEYPIDLAWSIANTNPLIQTYISFIEHQIAL